MEFENGCCEKIQAEKDISTETNLPSQLQDRVNSIIRKENYITHNINVKKICNDGGNYLAVLYEIDITGKTKNGNKEINLFIKNVIPVAEKLTEFFSITNAYAIECFTYKELAKIFTQLQVEAGVPVEDRYKIVKGYDESNTEAIILENMSKKGFKTHDRMKMVPLKFMAMSVQELAKFHSLGFVIEKKMPDYFTKKITNLEFPIKFNDEWEQFCKAVSNISINNLTGSSREKAKRFLIKSAKKYELYFKDKSTTCTICHGDFRANNILIKEVEGEVTEVIPIDHQVLNYGCPANDLLYFIYGCTDRTFRRQHMQDLTDLYYDTLNRFLKYFQIDANEVYPRKVFDSALKDREDLSLLIALYFFPFYFAPEDDVLDISKGFDAANITFDPKIVERIEEVIEDLDEAGLL